MIITFITASVRKDTSNGGESEQKVRKDEKKYHSVQ